MKQAMIEYVKNPKGDEFNTPIYAIKPILKYLKPNSRIWCPFDKAESNYVKVLKEAGHEVIYTIMTFNHESECPNKDKNFPFPNKSKCLSNCKKENDFLDYIIDKEDNIWYFDGTFRPFVFKKPDYIISNPPYSIKNQILKHLYKLGIPFAMLMPLTTLETMKRQEIFKKNGLDLILFDKRVNFIKNKSNWFNTSYFSWNLIKQTSFDYQSKIIFDNFEKEIEI